MVITDLNNVLSRIEELKGRFGLNQVEKQTENIISKVDVSKNFNQMLTEKLDEAGLLDVQKTKGQDPLALGNENLKNTVSLLKALPQFSQQMGLSGNLNSGENSTKTLNALGDILVKFDQNSELKNKPLVNSEVAIAEYNKNKQVK